KVGGGCDTGVDTTTDDCCCCVLVTVNWAGQLALVSVSFIFKAGEGVVACNGVAVVGGGVGNVLVEVKATLEDEGLGCKNVLTSGKVAFVLALRSEGDIDFSLVALLTSFLLCFRGGSIKVLLQATELRLLFLSSFSTLSEDLSLSLVDFTVFVLTALFLEDSCLTFVDFTGKSGKLEFELSECCNVDCDLFGRIVFLFKDCCSVTPFGVALPKSLTSIWLSVWTLEVVTVAADIVDFVVFYRDSSYLQHLDLCHFEDNGFATVGFKSGECFAEDSELGVVIELVPLVIGVPKRLVNVGNFASSERDLCFLISVTGRAIADDTIVAPTVPGTTPDTGTPPPLSNFKRNSSEGLSNINFCMSHLC
uniref:Uncharacterized protein n=1 Tax=Glossina palpalis gambiensis TaxID=67801 RepID=A0A1B0B5P5_9MUSC